MSLTVKGVQSYPNSGYVPPPSTNYSSNNNNYVDAYSSGSGKGGMDYDTSTYSPVNYNKREEVPMDLPEPPASYTDRINTVLRKYPKYSAGQAGLLLYLSLTMVF